MSMGKLDLVLPQVKERYLYWEERRRRLPLCDRQGRREACRHAAACGDELRAAGFTILPNPGRKYSWRRGAALLAVIGTIGGGVAIADNTHHAINSVSSSVKQDVDPVIYPMKGW
jgi:hypothetical protein